MFSSDFQHKARGFSAMSSTETVLQRIRKNTNSSMMSETTYFNRIDDDGEEEDGNAFGAALFAGGKTNQSKITNSSRLASHSLLNKKLDKQRKMSGNSPVNE
jgi:hypothetical protein